MHSCLYGHCDSAAEGYALCALGGQAGEWFVDEDDWTIYVGAALATC